MFRGITQCISRVISMNQYLWRALQDLYMKSFDEPFPCPSMQVDEWASRWVNNWRLNVLCLHGKLFDEHFPCPSMYVRDELTNWVYVLSSCEIIWWTLPLPLNASDRWVNQMKVRHFILLCENIWRTFPLSFTARDEWMNWGTNT